MGKIGNLKLNLYKNKADAAKCAADDIFEFLKNTKQNNQKTLFLVSGGSSFEVLIHLGVEPLSEDVTVSVLDERYDTSNENNNFSQLKKTDFFKKAKEAGVKFIDTSVKKNQTQDELRKYFENELKRWKKENANGKIIATVGVGKDGHTSGIMPYPEDEEEFNRLFEGENWVTAYDASEKNDYPKRVTTTNTFLRKINKIFVFAAGEEKKEVFKKIQEEGSLAEMPARILKELRGEIYLA